MIHRLQSAFYRHYTDTKQTRSKKQIEAEQWIFGGQYRFHRNQILPCAFLLQMCSGSMYAFSGYSIPIETVIYGENIQNGIIVDRNIASTSYFIVVNTAVDIAFNSNTIVCGNTCSCYYCIVLFLLLS